MPFSLSDSLLDRPVSAAETLPIHERGPFLRSVANQVADLPQIGTAEIETAIMFASRSLATQKGRPTKG
jgi:hypothetical protein